MVSDGRSESEVELWVFTISRASCNFWSFPAKAQKIEMDKLEKAKKERTKVAIQSKADGGAASLFPCSISFCCFAVSDQLCSVLILFGFPSLYLSFSHVLFQAARIWLFAHPYRSLSLGSLFHRISCCFVSIFKPELLKWCSVSQIQAKRCMKSSFFFTCDLVALSSYSLIFSLFLVVRQYLLSVLLDTAFLHLISRNFGPILTLTRLVAKCTFFCTPKKPQRGFGRFSSCLSVGLPLS